MRKFGIEIEGIGASESQVAAAITAAGIACYAEGYNHHTRNHWKVVYDASVRDSNGMGFEVVSPPLEGEAGLEQVRVVMNALAALGCKVNKTCGLHVHIDGAGLGMRQIRNLCKFYWRFEKQIDAIMPASRRNNQFCRSLRSVYGLQNEASMEATLDRCDSAESIASVLGTRYMKLNLESWMRHGTVEFRQHSGTMEAEKAINWIKFCQAMVAKTERAAYVVKKTEGSAYTVGYAVKYLTNDSSLVKFYTKRAKKFATATAAPARAAA